MVIMVIMVIMDIMVIMVIMVYVVIYLLGAVQPCGTTFFPVDCLVWEELAPPPCGDDNVVSKELSGTVGMLEKKYNLVAGLSFFLITLIG